VSQHVTAARLGELGGQLAAISYDRVDDVALVAARQRLLDTLAAVALGLHTPEGRLLERYVAQTAGPELAMGRRGRLLVGAARSTEVDDIDIASCTTVGSVVVPAAVSVAAAQPGTTARALLAGIVAGYEAMTRMGRAIGGATLLYRGVWPTYVTAAFGAAAATAKFLDLDAPAIARSLALALTRAGTVPGAALSRFGYRYYSLGCAAADGIDAAAAAAAGVDADLECIGAFAERLGATLDSTELTVAFGQPWRVAGVDTKPWPSARQALSSVAAFRRFASPAPEDIERIVVGVPDPYRAMIDRPAFPKRRIESLLGVQYQLGLAAFAPTVLDDVVRESLPDDPRIEALMRKVEIEPDADLGARFPVVWGSRVTLHLRSGAPTSIEVLTPAGSGAQPLEWGELGEKLERVFAASGWSNGAALAALSERCQRIGVGGEDRDVARDLLELTDALAKERDPA
jgi:2-methylcitrate dehydratase PrpD